MYQQLLHVRERLVVRVVLAGIKVVDVNVGHLDCLLGGSGRDNPAVRQHLRLQVCSLRFTEGSTHDRLAERAERGALQ